MTKRLILIDGHALAYRQYFALRGRELSTTAGEPTSAVFGFAQTLLQLLDSPPDYLAVVFDQGLSERETEFVGYKAHRPEMEQAMAVQLPRIRQLMEAFNIPILEKANYEADDVIGTVAKQAVAQGVDVHILTGDNDLLQLVNEHVTAELPGFRGEAHVYDVPGVIAKFGIRPEQIPDFKGLVGDSSDGIPGVKGIGEKTATPLLQQYGTLEALYEHLGEQQGKIRKKLEAGRESAFLSKRLATIKTDLDVTLDLQKCITTDYDPSKVMALFEALEFRSLLRRLKKLNGIEEPEPPKPTSDAQQVALFEASSAEELDPNLTPADQVVHTIIVNTDDKLADMLRVLEAAPLIAFDTETTGSDQMTARLVGISLAASGDVAYYIPVGHLPPDAGTLLQGEPPRQLALEHVIDALRPVMTDPHKPKAAHNAAYDLNVLRRVGLDVTPISYDTQIAEWLIHPDTRPDSRRGLKDLARTRFGVQMTNIEALIGKGKEQITMDRVPVERAAPYAAADAAMTYRLVGALRPELEQTGMIRLFEEIEMPLVPIIADLNMTGAKIDLPYLADLSREFNARLDEIKEKIYQSVGERFNIGSPKQLNEILFGKLRLPTKGLRKSSHGYSVDADALELLREQYPDVEAVRLILDWRALDKLRSTYVDALPKQVDSQGRVHTTYKQIGAVTGRLSSESPNLQNIPIRTEEGRRVRRAFIAPEGYYLLGVDYSQIELRILAHYSRDAALLEAFRQNQDIHRATAALVAGVPFEQVTKEQRYFAKRVNFGLLYGMGAARLARESELSRDEAKRFIDNYFQRLPGVSRYLSESRQRAYDQGYLETLFGRRRDFSALKNPLISGGDKARMEREAINMPIQGTAADIIKIAMIKLSARLKAEKPQVRMILQVHDELVFEVPDWDVPSTAALVREVMENAVELASPLRADANVGRNWAEMRPVEG